MIKKSIALVLVALSLMTISSADAAKKSSPANINFGSFSCADFMSAVNSGSEDDIAAMLIWLDGYLSGVSGDAELNWENFEAFSENIGTYCASNGRANLLSAAKKVGIQ